MTRDEIKQAVIGIVSEKMNVKPETLTEETSLEHDLNVDSLDTVEIVMGIEDLFGLNISDENAEQAKTIRKIIDLVVKLSGS